MCGIAFISDLNERTAELAFFLAYGIRYRGGDSWGMTNGRESYRQVGPITETWFTPPREWWGRPLLIHTRAATVGDVTVENCHPFDIQGVKGRIQGIHNGHVGNHAELNTKYHRTHECDSPHAFHHIVDGLDTGEVRMRGVIAWLMNDAPDIHFARSGSTDISIASLRSGEVIGCSVYEPIKFGCEATDLKIRSIYKLPDPDKEYIIRPFRDSDTIDASPDEVLPEAIWIPAVVGDMPFGTAASYQAARHFGYCGRQDPHSEPFEYIHSGGARNRDKSGETTTKGSSDTRSSTSTGTSKGTTSRSGGAARGGNTDDKPFRYAACAVCWQPFPPDLPEPRAFCVDCICSWINVAIDDVRAETAEALSGNGARMAPSYSGDASVGLLTPDEEKESVVLQEAKRVAQATWGM